MSKNIVYDDICIKIPVALIEQFRLGQVTSVELLIVGVYQYRKQFSKRVLFQSVADDLGITPFDVEHALLSLGVTL